MRYKRLLALLLSAVFCPALFGQTLIAYYPFDNNTADFSGYNNDGRFYGGVRTTPDRFGNPCGALHFNGRDGFIMVPSSPSLKSPVKYLSVSCWFKLDSPLILRDKKWLTLVCKGKDFEEAYNNPQYRVQVYQSPIQSTVSINTDFTEYDTNYVKNNFSHQWNFFALVYDGKMVKTFLNGAKIWEFPYAKTFNLNDDPLFIGKDIPGHTEYFHGSLDELRIYNSALSEVDINTSYKEDATVVSIENINLLCPQDITVNNDPGKCNAKVYFNKAAVDYDCGNATVTQTGGLPGGSNFSIGTTYITFETKSRTGVTKNCTTKITVIDNEPPSFICHSDTFIVRTDSNLKGMVYHYQMPRAVDNCSRSTITRSEGLPSGALFPEGQTILKFVAIDDAGNKSECSYAVYVTDFNAKKISNALGCPPDILKVNAPGNCGALVTYSFPDAGNGRDYKLTEGKASGMFFPVGTTINKFQKVKENNLVVECAFNVTVKDNENPVFTCSHDTIIYCKLNEASTLFSYETPLVTDNCGIESVVMIHGLASGAQFPAGITTLIHKATDYSGNASECSFNITVLDTNIVRKDTHEKTATKTYMPDKVKYDYDLKFNQCELTLFLYDDGEEDNDTVSVYFNGVEIVKREMIKLKGHAIITRTVALLPGEKNDFVVRAWNNGKISPNTIKIEFYEGNYNNNLLKFTRKKPKKVRVLHSKPGVAGAISIRCSGK